MSLALQADSLALSHLGSLLRGLMSLNDLASTHFPSTSLSFSYSGLLSVLKRWDFLPQALAEMTHTVHSECLIFSQVFLGLNPSHLLGLSLNAAWGFLSGSDGKRICLQHLEDPLQKEMATHSSILIWRIPRTEEPGRLQPMGFQRVRHD